MMELAAGDRLAAPPPPPRWGKRTRRLAWAMAAVVHALVIVLLLRFTREKPPMEPQSPPGISVVFDNGGTTQTSAPLAPRQGPESPAVAPPPAAPPPPQTAQAQPNVNLNLPDMPLPTVQTTPQPQNHEKPRPHAIAHPRPAPAQHYMVMNNMSFGNPSPPMPQAQQGMNLSLPMTDAQAVNGPELTIKGDIGADWDAELNQWVNDHKYYPQAAVEQNQQGNVEIEFTVDRAGNVTGLHMLGSSGSPFLDQAWLGLFADNTLPAFPPGTKADHVTVDATMHFELIQ